jgi:F-type H+-transporting ATPase subunit b
MKSVLFLPFFILVFAYLLFFLCPDVFAVEPTSPARKRWDNILLFVNFGILVFLFLKYARRPLMDLLRGKGREIKEELDSIDILRKNAKSTMDAAEKRLNKIDQHLTEIHENIVLMGKKEKDKIIQEGKTASDKLLRDAEIYSKNRMIVAKKELSDEFVDNAVAQVEEKLKKGISKEDNEKIIDQFIEDLETSKQLFS